MSWTNWNYSPTEVRILAGAEVRAGAEVCNLAGAGSEAGVGYLTETEAGAEAEFRVSEVAWGKKFPKSVKSS